MLPQNAKISSNCLRLIVLTLLVVGYNGFPLLQSVAVGGRIVCNGNMVPDVTVRLLETDDAPDDDDWLDEMKSDLRGMFHLKGRTRELTIIEPYLLIGCDGIQGCSGRKARIQIPEVYVSVSEHPRNTFISGNVELTELFDGLIC